MKVNNVGRLGQCDQSSSETIEQRDHLGDVGWCRFIDETRHAELA